MATAITCPSCRRALHLPAEAMNRAVQCPACKHQFHPAGALPAEAVRPALPKIDAAPATPSASPSSFPAERRPPPPPSPPQTFDVRRERRGQRAEEEVCPKCKTIVPRGADKCPECKAEFAPETDENYRPWEQEGMERRDSEPHRATMLMIMGIGSMVLACTFFVCYVNIVTTLLGLGLSIATIALGRADLKKMDDHVMNAAGRGTVGGAIVCGFVGLVLNGLGLPAAIALTAMLL